MFNKFLQKYGIYTIAVLLIATAFTIGFFAGSSATEKVYQDAPERETVVQYKPQAQQAGPEAKAAPSIEEGEPEEIVVTATAYCPCKKCCGKWADNRPNGIVYTASGTVAKAGRTIAVDPSVFPFGTVLEINGVQYVAEDTGSAIKGNKIDIYFDDHDAAIAFGIREMTATIV